MKISKSGLCFLFAMFSLVGLTKSIYFILLQHWDIFSKAIFEFNNWVTPLCLVKYYFHDYSQLKLLYSSNSLCVLSVWLQIFELNINTYMILIYNLILTQAATFFGLWYCHLARDPKLQTKTVRLFVTQHLHFEIHSFVKQLFIRIVSENKWQLGTF